MIKVLFICHGNICRSPMAEFVMKDIVKREGLEDEFYIESRATHTDEIWNGVGSEVYPPARQVLGEHGISCKGKRAQLLSKQDYRDYDYLIGMDSENARCMPRMTGGDPDNKMSLLMDYTHRPRSVADPWYTGNFDVTYRDVVEGCNGFLEYLKKEGLVR